MSSTSLAVDPSEASDPAGSPRYPSLSARSVRTLAWLGDAVFEQEVRVRVALRGDFPVDRLDAIKSAVVRAESQARMLTTLMPELTADELDTIRRAKNRRPSSSSHGRRSTQVYRGATGLEALVAMWEFQPEGRQRLKSLLVPLIEASIDSALARHRARPRRG